MRFIRFKNLLTILLCSIYIFNSGYSVSAKESTKNIPDVKDFEQMTDSFMNKAMEKYNIPNLTLSVVKDGEVYFKKGYGYADLENKTPVNPDTTAFEIGSITKVFTATAAMQLVEQGKLNLNEDINNYLSDFKIDNKFSNPVTLKNLLTHTAGFDERYDHSIYPQVGAEFYEKTPSLSDYLKKELPPIIREPNTCVQYSNHGYALAGYLVEKFSGIPFDKYITNNIFNQLNMKNTFYFLSKDNVQKMAKPYKYENGNFVPISYSIVIDNPAGSICSTASDMANFMIMHLNNGEYKGNRLLSSETATKMNSTHFTNDNHFPGYTLGFYESIRNGNKVLEHGGDTINFHSLISISPKQNIGFFLSFSNGDPNVREDFSNEFYKFFTEDNTDTNSATFNNEDILNSFDIKNISGTYCVTRYPHNDIFKILSIIPSSLLTKINVDNSGNIILPMTSSIKTYFNTNNSQLLFKPASNSLFYNSETNKYIKFIEHDNKTYLILDIDAPVQAFEKVPNIYFFLFYILCFGVLIAIIGMITALITLIKKKYKNSNRFIFISKILLLILCILLVIYPISYILLIQTGLAYNATNNMMIAIKIICVFTLFATIILNICNIISCKNKYFTIKTRIFYFLIGLLGIINVCFMYINNSFSY